MRKLSLALLLVALVPAKAMALNISELLATIAMPLAVAAVSDVTGVPQDQLADVVASLNQAAVPAPQVIEIIRYVPVALVVDNGQPFVQFVQQQVTQGVTGSALYPVITREIQTYYPSQTVITVTPPPPERVVFVERDFVPTVVVTRVAEVRAHPHGGPPGQIKKRLGLQTGAEVVHGKKPGRQFTPVPVAVVPVAVAPPPTAAPKEHGKKHDEGGGGKGKEKGGKHGGKGHGKDER